jgi:hypothetical protein
VEKIYIVVGKCGDPNRPTALNPTTALQRLWLVWPYLANLALINACDEFPLAGIEF